MAGLWLGSGQYREKDHFWQNFGLNKGKNESKCFCCALVRVRATIEKNTLFGIAFVRKGVKIEKKTNSGKAFVTIRAKKESKTPFVAGLLLGLKQNRENTILCRV